jgi:ABC-type lipoprotein export system ATPase subunit
MIQTTNLRFSYTQKSTFEFPDIHCGAGGKLLIRGKSGCGKTTLLHLLAGILTPSEGAVVIKGSNLYHLSEKEKDQFRGKHIGLISQKFHFINALSVEDNIRAAAYFSGKSIDANKLLQITDFLSIKHLLSRKTAMLSLGEQQRVCIARAIINAPAVLLADEPTSSLDDDNCREVIQLLETLCRQQDTALLVVTHDHRLDEYFDHSIRLS